MRGTGRVKVNGSSVLHMLGSCTQAEVKGLDETLFGRSQLIFHVLLTITFFRQMPKEKCFRKFEFVVTRFMSDYNFAFTQNMSECKFEVGNILSHQLEVAKIFGHCNGTFSVPMQIRIRVEFAFIQIMSE